MNASKIVKPYLIQRGEIERPLGNFRGARLSQAVDFDYMGSAEFEFGALPKSFRAMEAMADKASMTVLEEITEGDVFLRVFHFFDEQEFAEYKKHLINLRQDNIHTKERTCFNYNRSKYEMKFDFWWDIQNHVMWSFDKKFMNHIHDYLAASLNHMNEKKHEAPPASGLTQLSDQINIVVT